ncbi:MAG: hypothetical protein ACI4UL_08900 [Muribaculaceae bacterium]
MEEEKVYGESGLTDDDMESMADFRSETHVGPTPAASRHDQRAGAIPDNLAEVAQALADSGVDAALIRDKIFIDVYNQVVQGPGRDWAAYRRARFTLQTMNRMGALGELIPADPQPSAPAVPKEKEAEKPLPKPKNSPADEIAIFGYHHLDRSEIMDNLAIVGGVLGITLLAAVAMYLCVTYGNAAAMASTGTISLATIIAAVVRIASRWHQRFPLRYRMMRLVVCLSLLFSTAAWWAAKGAWMLACAISDITIDIPTFGVSLFGVLAAISIAAHLKLCRTYNPTKARILGWVEVVALTFAMGAFLFCAIHKP